MASEIEEPPARIAQRLMRTIDRATLASSREGWPYASLVLVALDAGGAPLLLLSDLAEHTKNLKAEPRASLLFDGTAGLNEPLTGSRVTVLGRVERADDPVLIAAFVARHEAASPWTQFGDFHLYRLVPARAHLVAGFGRIAWIDAAELVTAPA